MTPTPPPPKPARSWVRSLTWLGLAFAAAAVIVAATPSIVRLIGIGRPDQPDGLSIAHGPAELSTAVPHQVRKLGETSASDEFGDGDRWLFPGEGEPEPDGAAPGTTKARVAVTPNEVSLHAQAGPSTPVIGKVAAGARVLVVKEEGERVLIVWGGDGEGVVMGWASKGEVTFQ